MEKCILIYDDEEGILGVSKIILEKKKYRVETRTRCDDIIEDIKEVSPDIVLMDLWIPEMGGEKAVKLMKANDATRQIPVILFSANDLIEEISKTTDADGYLRKPFSISRLVQIVEDTFVGKG